ncbi:MAG: type II/IV secretion system protein [Candidatus Wallbacteria bacterium]|nr:type II/IV secretion system protein [Candidatus Wallbacteria bacterium]
MSKQFLEAGLLDVGQVNRALGQCAASGALFRDAVAELDLMRREEVCEFVSSVRGVPFLPTLASPTDERAARAWIPEEIARRYLAAPVSRTEGQLTIAMRNPFDVDAVDALEAAAKCVVSPVLALEEEILEALDRIYAKEPKLQEKLEAAIPELGEDAEAIVVHDVLLEAREDDGEDAGVVQVVNSILARAVRDQASDVHVEPEERNSRVRQRIDGIMRDVMTIPGKVHRSMVSRIKVMAEMDIAERRQPQDGRMRIRISERQVDLRVSTIPSIYGEKVVMRLLDYGVAASGLSEIGFSGDNLNRFLAALSLPHGLILVTGPTGSGKTTTLYTCLGSIDTQVKNVVTIEDPVEYNLPKINQIQVNAKAGITFASGLRSILRQDPDVILVGEMRDVETAQTAIRAALTGHLVLSTLHTNDAPSAMVRLVEMGVPPYLVASSVVAAIAQRLVRKLCQKCRQPYAPGGEQLPAHSLQVLADAPALYRAAGCADCSGTGYKGRIAILEMMTITESIRTAITAGKSAGELASLARDNGMVSMWDFGLAKVAAGFTALEELTRVIQPPETQERAPVSSI